MNGDLVENALVLVGRRLLSVSSEGKFFRSRGAFPHFFSPPAVLFVPAPVQNSYRNGDPRDPFSPHTYFENGDQSDLLFLPPVSLSSVP